MYIKTVGYRVLAFMIDVFIGGAIGVILNLLFGFGTLDTSPGNLSYSMNLIESTILYTGYFTILEYLMYGQTPGKKLIHIEVKTMGMKGFDKREYYLYRGFIKGILVLGSVISFLIVVLNKDKQSFHDLIMKTIVVRKVDAIGGDSLEENGID
jgi:uncharacterized RDD family membrane protein YckC